MKIQNLACEIQQLGRPVRCPSSLARSEVCHVQPALQLLRVTKCDVDITNAGMSINEFLEHGKKLASMVALRELNNTRAQPRPASPTMLLEYNNAGDMNGALWDLVQLVGDKA